MVARSRGDMAGEAWRIDENRVAAIWLCSDDGSVRHDEMWLHRRVVPPPFHGCRELRGNSWKFVFVADLEGDALAFVGEIPAGSRRRR